MPLFGRVVGPRILRFAACLLVAVSLPVVSLRAQNQRDGNDQNMFRGNRAEMRITVRDSTGQPIKAHAVVKLMRLGVLANQAATNNGHASFILPGLGDYTVSVSAPGFLTEQKDVNVPLENEVEVDVILRRDTSGGDAEAVPGKPLLAPKAQEAFNKGLQALSQDNLKDAQKQVAEAMKLAPGHPDVLYVQGVLFLKENKNSEAQEVLLKATQLDPKHAHAFAALGMTYVNEGKYDTAISPLEISTQLEPANWDAERTLAEAYYRDGRYPEALKAAQDALAKANGKAPEIELLVAESQVAVGRYEDAGATLRGFLQKHGDRPEAAKAKKWLERLKADGKIKG
jgi:thioredoxin-like negative regulator of GroEL